MTIRNQERLAGVLFIIATFSFASGSSIFDSVQKSLLQTVKTIGADSSATNFFEALANTSNQMVLAGVLESINAMAIVGIGVLLYQSLKRKSETIAIAYLTTRVLEAAILLSAMAAFTSLSNVTPIDNSAQEVGVLLTGWAFAIKQAGFQVAMLALGGFSTFFSLYLYKERLVPRWLSASGVIGYISLIISAVLELKTPGTGMMYLIPGAIFEVLFPVWLIVKGLNSSK